MLAVTVWLPHATPAGFLAGWWRYAAPAIALGGIIWIYVAGAVSLRRRRAGSRVIGRGQLAAFIIAMLALGAAIASPLDDLADSRLSAHMAQHLLIAFVAPPLFILARPAAVAGAGPPRLFVAALHRLRRLAVVRSIRVVAASPYAGTSTFIVIMWLWHVPLLYESALHHESIHAIEHASMFGTAWLFWRSVVLRPRPSWGVEPLLIFVTMLGMNGLGALLTFSRVIWYPTYAVPRSGLSPLHDQELAGLIMWLPANALLLAAILRRLWTWLESDPDGDGGRTAGVPQPNTAALSPWRD